MKITPARKWALQQIFFCNVLQELDTHFRALRIRYMPIKGAYLLCTGLAEKMKERIINDIDILVEEEHIAQVSDYFAGLHNTKLLVHYTQNYRPTETSFLYTIDSASVLIEIQCRLNLDARFLLPTRELFLHSRPSNEVRCLPCAEDSLLIFLCHLQSHIPFEFRPETMEEINLLAYQEGFAWQTFWDRCPATGIEPFIYFILKMYQKEYSAQIPPLKKYGYAHFLAGWFNESRYNRSPEWVRRVFLDLPFVRKPVRLIWYRMTHKKTKNKKHGSPYAHY